MSYLRVGRYDIWIQRDDDKLELRFEWFGDGLRVFKIRVDIPTIEFTDNGVFTTLSMECDKGVFKIVKNPLGITKFKLIKWKLPYFWGQGKESKASSIIDEIIGLAE